MKRKFYYIMSLWGVYSVDSNEQNEEENPCQPATSDPAVPDRCDYINPPAEFLFQVLFIKLTKYEVMTPFKRVRENKLYTNRDCVLSDITCDYNGVYNETNEVKHMLFSHIYSSSFTKIDWAKIEYLNVVKCRWGSRSAVSSAMGSWQSPSRGSVSKVPEAFLCFYIWRTNK